MKKPVLLVRADASAQIGAGHLMRCRALAQAWQDDGGEAVVLSHQLSTEMARQLNEEGIATEEQSHAPGSEQDGCLTIDRARTLGAQWTVADSYEFGSQFFGQLQAGGTRVVAFDDEGKGETDGASLVLCPWRMGAESGDRHLNGPAYALLRREFQAHLESPREIPPQAHRFLLTLGGGDPENWTGRLLEALVGPDSPLPPEAELVVVVGAANPHAETLAERLRASPIRARVERATREMARLLAWADLGLSASGSTCWEICALGLPSLVLPLNSNQLPIATGLASAGAAGNLGLAANFDAATFSSAVRALARDQQARSAMSQAGRRLVDGRGASRVVTQLKSQLVHLRPAGLDDMTRIWEWANDPLVRESSFRREPIAWEDHQRWFVAQLATPAVRFLVAELDGRAVAQVRFNFAETTAVISFSVSRELRGQRFASAILVRAAREIFQATTMASITALIRPGNEASLRAFLRAGFTRAEDTVEGGETARRYVLRRSDCPCDDVSNIAIN